MPRGRVAGREPSATLGGMEQPAPPPPPDAPEADQPAVVSGEARDAERGDGPWLALLLGLTLLLVVCVALVLAAGGDAAAGTP